MFRRTTRGRGRLLNERGQGMALLLSGLAALLWLAARAKGLV